MLGRGPGKIQRPIDRMEITVLSHQHQNLLACFAGGDNQGNLDMLARVKSHVLAQAEDRVEDKPLAVTELLKDPHRIGERPPASDESPPVCLEPQGVVFGLFERKAVRNKDGWIVFSARAAVRKERMIIG